MSQAWQGAAWRNRWGWAHLGHARQGKGWVHLGCAGLQQWALDQLPVGLVICQQLIQTGEEPVLLQVKAAVGCHGDAVVADFGLGPDREGTEMETPSWLQP